MNGWRDRWRIAASGLITRGVGVVVGSTPTFGTLGTATLMDTVDQADIPFPATVLANQIAVLQIATLAVSPANNVSVGEFDEIPSFGGSNDFFAGLFYKRCDGSEGGTSASVTFDLQIQGVARIILISGCKTSGVPYEDLHVTGATSASLATSALTTTGINRLAAAFCMVGRGTAIGAMTNSWAELTGSDTSGTSGNRLVIESQAVATASSIPAGAVTITSDDWRSWTLAFLPTGA